MEATRWVLLGGIKPTKVRPNRIWHLIGILCSYKHIFPTEITPAGWLRCNAPRKITGFLGNNRTKKARTLLVSQRKGASALYRAYPYILGRPHLIRAGGWAAAPM